MLFLCHAVQCKAVSNQCSPTQSHRPVLHCDAAALPLIAIPYPLLLCYSSHIRRPAFLTIPTLRLTLPQLIESALCFSSAFSSLSLPKIAVFSFALSLRTAPFLYIALSAYPIHGSLRTASPYHFKTIQTIALLFQNCSHQSTSASMHYMVLP